jgi:hypothetical protein
MSPCQSMSKKLGAFYFLISNTKLFIFRSIVTHMEPDITLKQEPSSTSSSSNDDNIPSNTRIDRLFAKSYGRSLMASYCDTYKSDFVLLGIPTLPATSILDADLRSTLEQFTLSDSVSEASCLVIDTNNL